MGKAAKGPSNPTIVLNKALVEVIETQEGLYPLYGPQGYLLGNYSRFLQVGLNSIYTNNKPQVLSTFNTKFQLLNISLEAGLAEPLQDFIDVLLVFQLVLRVYYNIIQIGRIEVVKVVKEYIVYIPLVRSQSVSQSKRKYLIFIRPVTGPEYSKILKPGVYPNLVKGLADIKLYKYYRNSYVWYQATPSEAKRSEGALSPFSLAQL